MNVFLDLEDVFHAGLTSCYFCEVKTPAFMAFRSLTVLPKASVGSNCVLQGTVRLQRVERFGELVDQNGNTLSDIPKHPLGCQSRFGYAQLKKIMKSALQSSEWLLSMTSSRHRNYDQGLVTASTMTRSKWCQEGRNFPVGTAEAERRYHTSGQKQV